MFASKFKSSIGTITVESAVAPKLTKAMIVEHKLNTDDKQNAWYFIRSYVALQYAQDALDTDLDQQAFDGLSTCTTYAEFIEAREEFKKFYRVEYVARNKSVTVEATIANAVDKAWERFKARAVKKGYTVPVNPKARTTPAKTGTKTGTGRGANNKGKGKNQQAAVKSAAEAVTAIIEVTKTVESDFAAALSWVRQNKDNYAAFLAWYKAQAEAQLNGTKPVIVPMTGAQAQAHAPYAPKKKVA